jgi:hypothetical protein
MKQGTGIRDPEQDSVLGGQNESRENIGTELCNLTPETCRSLHRNGVGQANRSSRLV